MILTSSSTNQGYGSVVYLLHGKCVRVIALATESLYPATQQVRPCGGSSLPALPTVLFISDIKICLLSVWDVCKKKKVLSTLVNHLSHKFLILILFLHFCALCVMLEAIACAKAVPKIVSALLLSCQIYSASNCFY